MIEKRTYGYEELMLLIPKTSEKELEMIVETVEKERHLYLRSLLKMIMRAISYRKDALAREK